MDEHSVITENEAREVCEACGWAYIADNDEIEAICGERDGIAHVDTILHGAHINDSIYPTWVDCWCENFAPADYEDDKELERAATSANIMSHLMGGFEGDV